MENCLEMNLLLNLVERINISPGKGIAGCKVHRDMSRNLGWNL